MRNCKDEFLEHTKNRRVKCALISQGEWLFDEDEKPKSHTLRIGYSDSDYKIFLAELNFTYDSGYGEQDVFGNIWYEDGTWSERGEYDGSEWWEHKTAPEIPSTLNAVT